MGIEIVYQFTSRYPSFYLTSCLVMILLFTTNWYYPGLMYFGEYHWLKTSPVRTRKIYTKYVPLALKSQFNANCTSMYLHTLAILSCVKSFWADLLSFVQHNITLLNQVWQEVKCDSTHTSNIDFFVCQLFNLCWSSLLKTANFRVKVMGLYLSVIFVQ